MINAYKIGDVYIRRSDKTRWRLVTWGDVSVTLASIDDDKITKKEYPSHSVFRKDYK